MVCRRTYPFCHGDSFTKPESLLVECFPLPFPWGISRRDCIFLVVSRCCPETDRGRPLDAAGCLIPAVPYVGSRHGVFRCTPGSRPRASPGTSLRRIGGNHPFPSIGALPRGCHREISQPDSSGRVQGLSKPYSARRAPRCRPVPWPSGTFLKDDGKPRAPGGNPCTKSSSKTPVSACDFHLSFGIPDHPFARNPQSMGIIGEVT